MKKTKNGLRSTTTFWWMFSNSLLIIIRPRSAQSFSKQIRPMSGGVVYNELVPPVLDKDSLLYNWCHHDHDTFHDFPPNEAKQIRDSLLIWYRSNRRKLPWRGDPPPYDGSTAVQSRKKTAKDTNQKSITSFFHNNSNSNNNNNNNNNNKGNQEKKDEISQQQKQQTKPLTITAYGVWVSEIMLQQTRVEAVIPYYLKWMDSFPTVFHLANATEEQVNSHWAGLGFYRRARLLHQGAKLVVDELQGELPDTVEGLMKISGIGQYTASAIASIAFGTCVPVVDGNVCRVLSRLRGIANHIKAPILKDKLGWRLAQQIVQAGDGTCAGEVNQALMELGATYCAPSGTGMDHQDPLKTFYISTKLAASFQTERKRLANDGYDTFPTGILPETTKCALCDPHAFHTVLTEFDQNWVSSKFEISHGPFPLAPPKSSRREEVLAVAVLSSDDDRWLLVRRPKQGLLAGQWEFPSCIVWSSASGEKTKKKKEKKRKDIEVPFVETSVRSNALEEFLSELTIDQNLDVSERTNLPETIEHIFSHVRHTMWIEMKSNIQAETESCWTSQDGRELRWMSSEDMRKVGITSEVTKILKAVSNQTVTASRKKRKKGTK